MTHDDKRNATTDLFAALGIATGKILTDFRDSDTARDVRGFFKQIDRTEPPRTFWSSRRGSVNRKRVQRLWREEGLRVPVRRHTQACRHLDGGRVAAGESRG